MDSCSRLTRSAAKANAAKTPAASTRKSKLAEANSQEVICEQKDHGETPVSSFAALWLAKFNSPTNEEVKRLSDVDLANDQQNTPCLGSKEKASQGTPAAETAAPLQPVEEVNAKPNKRGSDADQNSEHLAPQVTSILSEEAPEADAYAHGEDANMKSIQSNSENAAPSNVSSHPSENVIQSDKAYSKRLTLPVEDAPFMSSTKASANKMVDTAPKPIVKQKVKSSVVTAGQFDSRSIKQLKKEIKEVYASKKELGQHEDEEHLETSAEHEDEQLLTDAMKGLSMDQEVEPLKGLPLPEGTHVRYDKGKIYRSLAPGALDTDAGDFSDEPLRGLPEPCGTHIRFN